MSTNENGPAGDRTESQTKLTTYDHSTASGAPIASGESAPVVINDRPGRSHLAPHHRTELLTHNVYPYVKAAVKEGMYVFPVTIDINEHGKKVVNFPVQWQERASREGNDIEGWFNPDAGGSYTAYGIDCQKSGIEVYDLDGTEGIANWTELTDNEPIGDGMLVSSPGGGQHRIYKADPQTMIGNSASTIGPNIDTRGKGGIVFGPGSHDARGEREIIDGVKKFDQLGYASAKVREVVKKAFDKKKPAKVEAGSHGIDLFAEVVRLPRDHKFTREQANKFLNAALTRLAEANDGTYNTSIHEFALQCAHFSAQVNEEMCAKYVIKALGDKTGWTECNKQDFATIASAYKAMHEGDGDNWQAEVLPDTEDESPESVLSLRDRLLDFEALENLPSATPLIRDVLDLNSESWLIGPAGGFKSFVAVDWACHVATGKDWRGQKTTEGDVLYVVAEGAKSFAKRIKAWASVHERKPSRLKILPMAVQVKGASNNLELSDEWRELVRLVRDLQPSLVVLDTQARMTVGLEENSAKEMGLWVQGVTKLKEASSGCVLVVHHSGRAGKDARGSSAIDAAQDTEWRVERTGGKDSKKLEAKLMLDKAKDGDGSASFGFRLDIVIVGQDAEGIDITSLVLGEEVSTKQKSEREVMDELAAEGESLGTTGLITKALDEFGSEENGLTIARIVSFVNNAKKTAGKPAVQAESINKAIKRGVAQGAFREIGTGRITLAETP